MTGDDGRARPGPGEAYNPGPPAQPRQAATVILLRGGASSLETLMVRRSPHARFMAGVWVFPGGALEASEHEHPDAHRRAALRELHEEAGVRLHESAELIEFSRWITPAEVSIRFDTRFFLAEMPDGQEVLIDGREIVEHRWLAPADALASYDAGDLALVFPTLKHLERLSAFETVHELLASSRGQPVGPVQPKVILDGPRPRLVLPGEPGY